MIERIVPMLGESISPNSNLSEYEGDWVAQQKLDGTRVIALKDGPDVYLVTRSWKTDLTLTYPGLATAIRGLDCESAILDAELVFADAQGVERFLTARATTDRRSGLSERLVVFDVLSLNGDDKTSLPYSDRMNMIPHRVGPVEPIFTHFYGFQHLFDRIVERGGEGIMLKRLDSPYRQDGVNHNRSRDWLKVKRVATADCIVLGLQTGKGKTSGTFGALVLGQYVGNHIEEVGRCSGMTDAERADLFARAMMMQDGVMQDRTVFKSIPIGQMIVEVAYQERTARGMLRHPRYICRRTDKSPRECVAS
jgi:bifunctional non-homologous end joining protein LigD